MPSRPMRGLLIGATLALSPLAVPATAAWSQASAPAPGAPASAPAPGLPAEDLSPTARGRAANVARMAAEKLNGGLGVYRTAACMHVRGGGECLIRRDADGFVFRFLGGPPGWQQLGLPATRETEMLIAPDGSQVLQVLYNGAPR